MADKIYAKGLKFFKKRDTAPEWVLGTIVVTEAQVAEMFAEQKEHITDYQGQKQLRLQLLKSQDGGMYATIDTWKPNQTAAPSPTPASGGAGPIEDLPF